MACCLAASVRVSSFILSRMHKRTMYHSAQAPGPCCKDPEQPYKSRGLTVLLASDAEVPVLMVCPPVCISPGML